MKSLLWLTLPVLLLAHCLGIAVSLYTAVASKELTFSASLREYFWPPNQPKPQDVRETDLYVQSRFLQTMLLLFLIGMCLLLTNALAHGLFDADGCIDPLMRTTIAAIRVDPTYQWLFVTLSAASIWWA